MDNIYPKHTWSDMYLQTSHEFNEFLYDAAGMDYANVFDLDCAHAGMGEPYPTPCKDHLYQIPGSVWIEYFSDLEMGEQQ